MLNVYQVNSKVARQAFINYNFSCARFHAHKTVLGARPCTWETVHIKEQTSTLIITTWFGNRNCTKLVLKPLVAEKSYVLLLYCRLYYFNWHDDYPPFLYTTWSICIATPPFSMNLNEKCCSESNILNLITCSWKFQFSFCLHTTKYHYLFEDRKVLRVKLRQIFLLFFCFLSTHLHI